MREFFLLGLRVLAVLPSVEQTCVRPDEFQSLAIMLTVCLLVLSGCAAVNRTGWLSSSNSFTLTASSSLDGFPPENAVPASSSSWSAGENNDEQWIQVSDVINMC